MLNPTGKSILFIDEIHRFNKLQQDALLPYVENGTIILIGATTENPYFEVNKALISRSMVIKLEPLTQNDIFKILKNALTNKEGLRRLQHKNRRWHIKKISNNLKWRCKNSTKRTRSSSTNNKNGTRWIHTHHRRSNKK